ncbi:MAG: MmgE/PrpD family protein [Rubrivivax sp.]
METTIQRLARYAVSTGFDDLSPAAVHECKRRLVDAVACAAAAYDQAYCQRIRAFADLYAGKPAARVWGSGMQTSMEMAAFANGTMVRYLDYNDTHLGRGAGHPSDMIPALMATAEACRQDGRSLAAAIVVAYELFCGLCDAPADPRAFDQSTCAAVGAAAGAGRLLGLDEAAMGHALSLALASNVNLFNVRRGALSDWKGSAGANGARNGLFAALLARAGVTGPSDPVHGLGGLAELAGSIDWQAGSASITKLELTHIKPRALCYHGQSAIDALLRLRPSVPLDAIAAIEVQTYESAFLAMGADPSRWAPTTRETADHSLPFTIASALLDGRIDLSTYAAERFADPRIGALMAKVQVTAADEMTKAYPRCAPARVTLRSTSGQAWTRLQEFPPGHAANPIDDAELERKFFGAFAAWGGDAAAQRALGALWGIDRLDDVSRAVDSLSGIN